MRSEGNIRGNLRKTQMITGMGPGAIADLKKGSVIISGISNWKYEEKDILHSAKLERLLGVKFFVTPPRKNPIRTENGTEIQQKDILAYQFPRWGYCPVCNKLGEVSDFTVLSTGRWICNCGKKAPIIPSRFIVACEDGHISDFPYRDWVHENNGNFNCKEELTIHQTGESAGLESIFIKCKCGAKRNLEGIFNTEKFHYMCKGEKPWLGKNVKDEKCTKEVKVLQRSSSAVYYPVTLSSIEVPQWDEKLEEEIKSAKNWINETNQDMFADLISKKLQIPLEDVLDAMNKKISWSGSLEDEYRALRREYTRKDFNSKIEDVPNFLEKYIDKIVLIKKMTEVIAQLGFKRIEAAYDIDDEKTYTSFKNEGLEWLPAIENKGEGIFIEFNEEKISTWETSLKVQKRYAQIMQREDETFLKGLRKPITPRTILLHTIAHSLIKELTFECGYSTSSIKERIYSTYEGGKDMSGILLYTTSSDSDGSLGGLVSQGKKDKLEQIFRRMIDNLAWCSTDPLCIETELHGYKNLNYAACHACTLLPETSCELRNVLLDRASIRGTLEDVDLGFFNEFYRDEEI
jgi:hypothetical protein